MDLTSRNIATTGVTGGLLAYSLTVLLTFLLGKPSFILLIIPLLLIPIIIFGYSVNRLYSKWTKAKLDDQDSHSQSPDPDAIPEGNREV